MRLLPRTVCTCALCAVLGATAGLWHQRTGPIGKETPDAKLSAKPAQLPGTKPDSVSKPSATSPSISHYEPLVFTSVTASMEWIWKRMDAGDMTAAEELFLQGSSLTEEQRVQLAAELVQSFRRLDPNMLARIVLSLPEGAVADQMLNKLVAEWSRYDSDEALRFLQKLPDDRLNQVLLVNAAFGLTRLPAERVIQFASHLNDAGRAFLAEGLVAFADQAGSWRNTSLILSKLDAQPHQAAVSVEWDLGVHLSDIAPAEIERQITTETDPVKRDQLLAGHAWNTGTRDPEQGILLDTQIERSQVRDEYLKNHTTRWLESDRAAALAWLQSDSARQWMNPQARADLLKAYGLEAAP